MKTATAEKPKPNRVDEAEPELSPELSVLYFTRADVLRILGDPHPETLERWKRRGIGPPQTTLPGRLIVFSKTSFFEWIKNREPQPRRVRRNGTRSA